ncbi:MAG TPA: hypothetical protein VKU40_04025, partial [Thermoanaerobaculia bacterium]|nr:hypothetical protein [Thermoanaerobaculia bacterium]
MSDETKGERTSGEMASGGGGRARVRLKPKREGPLLQGHPWVFSGAVASVEGANDAPLAEVTAADGRALGVGWWSPGSQIRVRML